MIIGIAAFSASGQVVIGISDLVAEDDAGIIKAVSNCARAHVAVEKARVQHHQLDQRGEAQLPGFQDQIEFVFPRASDTPEWRVAGADGGGERLARRRDERLLEGGALAGGAAQAPERFEEERLDVVRLQATRLGALHLFAHARHAARVHCVVRKRASSMQILAGAAD